MWPGIWIDQLVYDHELEIVHVDVPTSPLVRDQGGTLRVITRDRDRIKGYVWPSIESPECGLSIHITFTQIGLF